ncbi:hypothetical protein CR513_01966, partial [Mucuna pruriens]
MASPANLTATTRGPSREHLTATQWHSMSAIHSEATSVPAQRHITAWSSLQCKTHARIEKPKVAGGDRLEYQRTLENLILCTLATQGEPSSSVTAIVVNNGTTKVRAFVCLHLAETKPDCLCRDHLDLVSAESDSTSAEEIQLFSLFGPCRDPVSLLMDFLTLGWTNSGFGASRELIVTKGVTFATVKCPPYSKNLGKCTKLPLLIIPNQWPSDESSQSGAKSSGTPRQPSIQKPRRFQLSSTSLPGVACNASHNKVSFAPCINKRNSDQLGVFWHSYFPASIISNFSRFPSSAHDGARCYYWHFSRLRNCRLGTEKQKVTREDRLEHQRTLVDLILSVLASRGGSSPSSMAIAMGDGITESRPCLISVLISIVFQPPSFIVFEFEAEIARLYSVHLHSAETKPDYLYRDHLGSVSAESNSVSAESSKRLKEFIIKLASLPGTQVPLSSTNPLYTFDPEIELTLCRLWKIRNTIVNISSSVDLVINSDQSCSDHSVASTNIFSEPGQMENHDRRLKELATSDVVYQPWCIQYPQLEPTQTYELKSGLIHLWPKFHGLAGEDPHKHLEEFHVVCSTMRP